MLKTIKNASIAPAANDDIYEAPGTKKMSIIAMRAGNRPLQGTKLLVSTAISRSRGDSIILQPVTPQALQPKPIHMVRDCLPCAPQHLKAWSRLNAILGRYPKSSSNVNNGKKIAIGGSITDITHVSVV